MRKIILLFTVFILFVGCSGIGASNDGSGAPNDKANEEDHAKYWMKHMKIYIFHQMPF